MCLQKYFSSLLFFEFSRHFNRTLIFILFFSITIKLSNVFGKERHDSIVKMLFLSIYFISTSECHDHTIRLFGIISFHKEIL